MFALLLRRQDTYHELLLPTLPTTSRLRRVCFQKALLPPPRTCQLHKRASPQPGALSASARIHDKNRSYHTTWRKQLKARRLLDLRREASPHLDLRAIESPLKRVTLEEDAISASEVPECILQTKRIFAAPYSHPLKYLQLREICPEAQWSSLHSISKTCRRSGCRRHSPYTHKYIFACLWRSVGSIMMIMST